MQRILAISLGVMLFSQSVNIHIGDLAQLDDLIEHASYHQEQYGDDWLTFFQKHLGSKKEKHIHQEHQDRHENIPHHDHLCSNILPVVILQDKVSLVNHKQNIQAEKTFFLYQENYSFQALNEFFQPPRLV